MQLELSFDNEPRVVPGVQTLLQTTLDQLALGNENAARLAELVAAAVGDAIARAYPPGETGTIQLSLREAGGKLEILVRDFGLPQDIHQLEAQLDEPGAVQIWLRGARAADLVDQLHWLAFGPRGKALQLIKWLDRQHVAEGANPAELAAAPPHVALAPPQQYTVRRMQADEATQVSQLMYRTYGGTYFNADVYYPRRIARQNQEEQLISVVAVTAAGQVAGHCALERNQPGPVAEIGQAAVDPAHRGRGLLDQMKALLERQACELGLVGWFADAVTVHTFTQQSDAHHGGHVCGVDLAVSPRSESFRGIAQHLKQRVSCVLYFRPLTDAQPRTLFVPPRHQEIVAAIYEPLGQPIEFGTPAPPTAEHGELQAKFSAGAALGVVRVETLGRDSSAAIRHAVRSLVEHSRAEVVVVELPLGEPATAIVADELAAAGLAFNGVGPHFAPRGDVLKLTYLVDPLERAPIQTFEPLAARLVDYALAEQARVRANQ
ncbi:MAG: GNAT family N-acetyltransferase [Pirellulales bacterium]